MGAGLTAADHEWLVSLMDIDTVSPLEGGDLAGVIRAQTLFAAGAKARGFYEVLFAAPPPRVLELPGVPSPVLAAAHRWGPDFLDRQPSVVVGLGRATSAEDTIVINFHIDTVGPHLPVVRQGAILRGRGAVDDKGPGVAAVAGVRAAFDRRPDLADRVRVLIASVPGEEGGALGTYGTRWLVDAGHTGRLMLFAEPTGNDTLDACSAAMTPRFSVRGEGSTDDHPERGHNATVALGFLAALLTERLGPVAAARGAKVTVAGLHTGHAHNRVYGTGDLLLNIAYFDTAAAVELAGLVDGTLHEARDLFARRFAGLPGAARLVEDWDRVVRLDWLKRDIPPLANRDPAMESLLAAAGLPRRDGVADGTAFTCDAIWAAGPSRYVAVGGPGSLAHNGAHTDDEWVDLADLDRYAASVADLVTAFAERKR